MIGEICISKSCSLFPSSTSAEQEETDVRQRAPLHCNTFVSVFGGFVSVFGGFEVAFKSKCSRRMVNSGGVLSLRMPASYKVSLSLLIARHTQQRPLALEIKNHISNSSSVLLLKHLRHVWLWLFQERSNLCC